MASSFDQLSREELIARLEARVGGSAAAPTGTWRSEDSERYRSRWQELQANDQLRQLKALEPVG